MRTLWILAISSLILFIMVPVYADRMPIGELKINATKARTAPELAKRSSLIVYGSFDAYVKEYPTKDKVAQGRLVNYVQNFRVVRSLKGSAPATVKVITTGVNPYPKPTDPINKLYSGPFETGEYILFLRSIPNTSLYSIVGIWQGVYPVLGGRTIALEGSGFPDLNALSVDQFSRKIESMRSFE